MSSPTPPLAEFIQRYREDDNEWWRIECGHHKNLFEEAIDALEEIASGSTHCAPGINGAVMMARRVLGNEVLGDRGRDLGQKYAEAMFSRSALSADDETMIHDLLKPGDDES